MLVAVADVVLAELAGRVAVRSLSRSAMVGSSAVRPSFAPGRPTLVSPVRIGDWPVRNAARPAVQLCCPYQSVNIAPSRPIRSMFGRPVAHRPVVVDARVPPADVVAPQDQDVRLAVRHRASSLADHADWRAGSRSGAGRMGIRSDAAARRAVHVDRLDGRLRSLAGEHRRGVPLEVDVLVVADVDLDLVDGPAGEPERGLGTRALTASPESRPMHRPSPHSVNERDLRPHRPARHDVVVDVELRRADAPRGTGPSTPW